MRAAGLVTSFAPMTSATSVGGKLGVDVVHIEQLVVGTFASASSTFICPGMRPATGWMA